jgi:hypothetical protein
VTLLVPPAFPTKQQILESWNANTTSCMFVNASYLPERSNITKKKKKNKQKKKDGRDDKKNKKEVEARWYCKLEITVLIICFACNPLHKIFLIDREFLR